MQELEKIQNCCSSGRETAAIAQALLKDSLPDDRPEKEQSLALLDHAVQILKTIEHKAQMLVAEHTKSPSQEEILLLQSFQSECEGIQKVLDKIKQTLLETIAKSDTDSSLHMEFEILKNLMQSIESKNDTDLQAIANTHKIRARKKKRKQILLYSSAVLICILLLLSAGWMYANKMQNFQPEPPFPSPKQEPEMETEETADVIHEDEWLTIACLESKEEGPQLLVTNNSNQTLAPCFDAALDGSHYMESSQILNLKAGEQMQIPLTAADSIPDFSSQGADHKFLTLHTSVIVQQDQQEAETINIVNYELSGRYHPCRLDPGTIVYEDPDLTIGFVDASSSEVILYADNRTEQEIYLETSTLTVNGNDQKASSAMVLPQTQRLCRYALPDESDAENTEENSVIEVGLEVYGSGLDGTEELVTITIEDNQVQMNTDE